MISKFELHTDILVLGSEPSGFAAAYTAAGAAAAIAILQKCSLNNVDAEKIREIVGI